MPCCVAGRLASRKTTESLLGLPSSSSVGEELARCPLINRRSRIYSALPAWGTLAVARQVQALMALSQLTLSQQ